MVRDLTGFDRYPRSKSWPAAFADGDALDPLRKRDDFRKLMAEIEEDEPLKQEQERK